MGMIETAWKTNEKVEAYLGDDKKVLRRCIILSLIATIVLYVIPYIGGSYLDNLISSTGPINLSDALDVSTLILLMIAIWYMTAMESKSRMTKIALKVSRRMREDMNRKMMKVPVSYLDEMSSGDLSSRFTIDLQQVAELVSEDIVGFMVHITMIIAILMMMAITSPILAVLYFMLIPVILLASKHLTKQSENDFAVQKKKVSELNSGMSDIVRSHDSIRMENLEDEVLDRFRESNRDFTQAFVSSQVNSGMIAPIASVVSNSGYFMTVVVGAILMYNGLLQVGMFLTFMIYVRVVNGPLMMSAKTYNKMRDESISLSRVMEVIESPEESFAVSEDARITKGEIRVENVSFSYEEGQEILHDVSFVLEPGTITAVVGPTASGKTTIANLMMGFYKPDSGSIKIDGHDVSSIPRQAFGDTVGIVLQDPWVFEGTIRENIMYNRDISEEYMLEISRITGLDDFVRNLANGYDTVIGSNRGRLPLAQRRMVALARALAGNPKIMILDEAVAGLDPITGQRIIRRLTEQVADCTVMVISHNQALIDQADRIIRLENGHIVSDA